MLKKLLSILAPNNPEERDSLIYRNFLRDAAQMGGSLFGEVPKGNRREFFCLDEHTWIWHEEWNDANGNPRVLTTRYDIRPQGIYKAQDGQPYQPLTAEEAARLYAAMLQYQRNLHERFDPLLAAAA